MSAKYRYYKEIVFGDWPLAGLYMIVIKCVEKRKIAPHKKWDELSRM